MLPCKTTTTLRPYGGTELTTDAPKNSHKARFVWIVCFALIAVTAGVYWQVKNHPFIVCDDPVYITENPSIQQGITPASIAWAFTTMYANFWHPLTWLSHMLDVELFGLNPGGHHLMNVFFHVANTLLLFLVLQRMTKTLWQSAFVAALFALHPLHVESVAWASERKDVLSTLFWMLTMGAYVFYVEKGTLVRYLAVVSFFALGLMAKPMLVTLPFVLLLLDFWPLGRIYPVQSIQSAHAETPSSPLPSRKQQKKHTKGTTKKTPQPKSQQSVAHSPRRVLIALIMEKIPLLLLSAGASVVAYIAQQEGGALGLASEYPLGARIGNALVSYTAYIWKMIWPVNLSVWYPHPGMLPPWHVLGAACFLIVITGLALWNITRFPYVTVGWFWYIGTLVPVIGLVQVGGHGMADRYTYVPLIGLFVMIAWGIPDLFKKYPYRHQITVVTACFVITFLSIMTWQQLQLWKDDVTLFTHTLKHTKDNHIAEKALGIAFSRQGKWDEALRHLTRAYELYPHDKDLHLCLGNVYSSLDRSERAIAHYREALRIDPGFAKAYFNLGNVYAQMGKREDALISFSKAIELNPHDAEAFYNMGCVFFSLARFDKAISCFREAIRIRPAYAKAHNNLGSALLVQGKREEAIAHFQDALSIQPDFALARENLKKALAVKLKKGTN